MDKSIGTDDDIIDYLFSTSSVSHSDLHNLEDVDQRYQGITSGESCSDVIDSGLREFMHFRANQYSVGRNFEDINSCYDLDSVSQISALDSASQTGGCSVSRNGGSAITDYGLNQNYPGATSDRIGNRSNMVKQFSSDSNIHRSFVITQKNQQSQKPTPGSQDSFGMGMVNDNENTTTIKRGQFPYAYIRSRLAVLPEEQAGQISRRESMNRQSDQLAASVQYCNSNSKSDENPNNQKHKSTRSESGAQTDHVDNSSYQEIPEEMSDDANCYISKHSNGYTSLRARKIALRRKRSLSVADIPVINNTASEEVQQGQIIEHSKLTEPNHQKPHIKSTNSIKYEESGYDSDATRKSSPRGSLKHCSTSGSGSASISESNSSGGHNSCEESNSSAKELSSDDTNSSNGGEDCQDEETRNIGAEDEQLISSGSEDSGAVFKTSAKNANDKTNKPIEQHIKPKMGMNPVQTNHPKVTSNNAMHASRINSIASQFSVSSHGISSSGNTIKKPPRKSKLPEPVNPTSTLKKKASHQTNLPNGLPHPNNSNTNETSRNTTSNSQQIRKFKKNGEIILAEGSSGDELGDHEKMAIPSRTFASTTNLASQKYLSISSPDQYVQNSTLSSKRFKMLRLKKDGTGCDGELGIVISKKSNSQKGTTGYIVAHIEPGGLVERYVLNSIKRIKLLLYFFLCIII